MPGRKKQNPSMNHDHDQKIIWVDKENLLKPNFYLDFFPLGRDLSELRNSVRKNGFWANKILVVRKLKGKSLKGKYEIVIGYGPFCIAVEEGITKFPCLVEELTEDGARIKALSDTLSEPRTPVSVVEAVYLSLVLEQFGEKVPERELSKKYGITRTKHARTLIEFAIQELRKKCKSKAQSKELRIEELGDPEKVSMIQLVRFSLDNKVWAEFNAFFSGEMKVNTFRKQIYTPSKEAKERSEKMRSAKKIKTSEATTVQKLMRALDELGDPANWAADVREAIINQKNKPKKIAKLEVIVSIVKASRRANKARNKLSEPKGQSVLKDRSTSRSQKPNVIGRS